MKIAKIKEYTVLLTPDAESGWFVAEVPALPGCVSQGKTVDKALQNAKEAMELWLEVYQEKHRRIPEDAEPNFFKAKVAVSVFKHQPA